MKKLLALSLSAFAGSFLAVFLLGLSSAARAGGGDPISPPCSARNGDVNGDGSLDLSDAVTILNHLFAGTPTELIQVCTPYRRPDTGQEVCYGVSGVANVPCDSAQCKGQDGAYQTGCPSEDRFVDNGDGTVTDNCTGLTWFKNVADTDNDGAVNPADRVLWCRALTFCEELSFAGHDDWRLPNINELQTIINYGPLSPAYNYLVYPRFRIDANDWSSTTEPRHGETAFSVNYGTGTAERSQKANETHSVRPVRGGR